MAGFVLTAYFDLASSLPLSDEWMFWFPLQSLKAGRGFELWPGALPLSLVQLAATLPLAGAAPPVWRLVELPFLALAGGCCYLLARRLGADRFWSAAATASVVIAPVTLSVATGYTSDIAYLGLMLAACLLAVRWLEGQGRPWPVVLLVVMATLQRQHGFLVALALAAAVLAGRRWDRRSLTALSLVVAAAAVAVIAPFTLGITTTTMNGLRAGSGRLGPTLGSVLATVVVLGPMVGVFFLPLVPALLLRPGSSAPATRWQLVPVGVWAASLAGCAAFLLLFQGNLLPGNVLGIWGLGPTHVGGHKPPLLGIAGYLVLEAAAVAAFTVILLGRRRDLQPGALGAGGMFLVLVGLSQLMPMPATSPLDRYFIQVLAPMAPVFAVMASRSAPGASVAARGARWAAVLLLGGGVALYVVGEQDYQAWQAAREQAARLAYTRVPPARVEAGYEAVANHAAVPEYLLSRRITIDPIDLKPPDPQLRLEFAAPGDPRPGYRWTSLSPGKVVIVCLVSRPACPFSSP